MEDHVAFTEESDGGMEQSVTFLLTIGLVSLSVLAMTLCLVIIPMIILRCTKRKKKGKKKKKKNDGDSTSKKELDQIHESLKIQEAKMNETANAGLEISKIFEKVGQLQTSVVELTRVNSEAQERNRLDESVANNPGREKMNKMAERLESSETQLENIGQALGQITDVVSNISDRLETPNINAAAPDKTSHQEQSETEEATALKLAENTEALQEINNALATLQTLQNGEMSNDRLQMVEQTLSHIAEELDSWKEVTGVSEEIRAFAQHISGKEQRLSQMLERAEVVAERLNNDPSQSALQRAESLPLEELQSQLVEDITKAVKKDVDSERLKEMEEAITSLSTELHQWKQAQLDCFLPMDELRNEANLAVEEYRSSSHKRGNRSGSAPGSLASPSVRQAPFHRSPPLKMYSRGMRSASMTTSEDEWGGSQSTQSTTQSNNSASRSHKRSPRNKRYRNPSTASSWKSNPQTPPGISSIPSSRSTSGLRRRCGRRARGEDNLKRATSYRSGSRQSWSPKRRGSQSSLKSTFGYSPRTSVGPSPSTRSLRHPPPTTESRRGLKKRVQSMPEDTLKAYLHFEETPRRRQACGSGASSAQSHSRSSSVKESHWQGHGKDPPGFVVYS